MTSPSSSAVPSEKALLGSVLLCNHLWQETSGLTVADFLLDSHRRIYSRMVALFEDRRAVDLVTLTEDLAQSNQLDTCGRPGYLASLIDDATPENIPSYVRSVRERR